MAKRSALVILEIWNCIRGGTDIMQSPEGLSCTIPPVGILGKVCIIVITGHSYKKKVIISARETPGGDTGQGP